MQYRECPYCGANLDPGERCECQSLKAEAESEAEAAPQVYQPAAKRVPA